MDYWRNHKITALYINNWISQGWSQRSYEKLSEMAVMLWLLFLLLKFSNIFVLIAATRHLEAGHVPDLAWQLVVSWSWGLHLFAACDVRSLTCSKTELGRWGLEFFGVLLVVAWPWHLCIGLRIQTAFQLDTHWEVGAGPLRKSGVGIKGAWTWNLELL